MHDSPRVHYSQKCSSRCCPSALKPAILKLVYYYHIIVAARKLHLARCTQKGGGRGWGGHLLASAQPPPFAPAGSQRSMLHSKLISQSVGMHVYTTICLRKEMFTKLPEVTSRDAGLRLQVTVRHMSLIGCQCPVTTATAAMIHTHTRCKQPRSTLVADLAHLASAEGHVQGLVGGG